MDENKNVEVIETPCDVEEVEEPMTRKEKAKAKVKEVWKKHGEKIVIGGFYAVLIGVPVLYAIHGFKQEKEFNAAIREMYGPTVTEGNLFGGPIKKRWAAHEKWEREDKGNFDKVVDFVKQLDLKDNESYSIDRVIGDNGGLITEVVQMTGNGFYHGELC